MATSSPAKGINQKITISLPHTLAERLNAQVSARQRSVFITKVLEDYLAVAEQVAILDETAGCWSDEHHPELASGQEIDAWLAALRGEW